jgi:anti-anti-sigma factor
VRPLDRLTKVNTREFEEFLLNALDEGFRNVIFDFSQLSLMSSEGLLTILNLIKEIRSKGGEVVSVGFKPKVRPLFAVSGMFALLEESEDLPAAINHLQLRDTAFTNGEGPG